MIVNIVKYKKSCIKNCAKILTFFYMYMHVQTQQRRKVRTIKTHMADIQ